MLKKNTLTLIASLSVLFCGNAQVFDVDTLQFNGDPNHYINLVILGDGYTTADLGKFKTDAKGLSDYLFKQSPWSHYKSYFNIFMINVISNQSGCKHPNTAGDCGGSGVPVSNPDTYFGCTFDAGGIHRLVVPGKPSAIAGVLSSNFPNYDQVFIIANTPYYGGSGGAYATSTTEASANEISAHEIGHSFAYLADEYYAGDVYAIEKPNMTQQTDPNKVKWKNWMGKNGIGINKHCCGGNSALWYKPHTGCKMQMLGPAYCSVCQEAITEKIHSLVNPVVRFTPSDSLVTVTQQILSFRLTELMKPVTNSLLIDWKLDGTRISANTDSVKVDLTALSSGQHALTVSVTDTSYLLKVDNHSAQHISTVNWKFTKAVSGIKISAIQQKIAFSIYPNPAIEQLNITIELEKNSATTIDILTMDGKKAKQVLQENLATGSHSLTVDVSALAKGIYLIVFNIDGVLHSETFIKE